MASRDLTQLENCLVARLDVTDSASIEQAVSEGVKRFGSIDVLLNVSSVGGKLTTPFGSLDHGPGPHSSDGTLENGQVP